MPQRFPYQIQREGNLVIWREIRWWIKSTTILCFKYKKQVTSKWRVLVLQVLIMLKHKGSLNPVLVRIRMKQLYQPCSNSITCPTTTEKKQEGKVLQIKQIKPRGENLSGCSGCSPSFFLAMWVSFCGKQKHKRIYFLLVLELHHWKED